MYTTVARSGDRLNSFVKLSTTPRGLLDNFFEMPWGGNLWQATKPEEICDFFLDTLKQIEEQYTGQRAEAIKNFRAKSAMRRLYMVMHRWSPPEVPTLPELINEIIYRCSCLIEYIDTCRMCGFFRNSDLPAFADKVREVIALLNRSHLRVV